eukprot:ctg_6574.g625
MASTRAPPMAVSGTEPSARHNPVQHQVIPVPERPQRSARGRRDGGNVRWTTPGAVPQTAASCP